MNSIPFYLAVSQNIGPALANQLHHIIMSTVLFAIVMLHLLIGFGYVLYRISRSDGSQKDIGTGRKDD